jgi:serine endopeptidase inhibitor I10-like protein
LVINCQDFTLSVVKLVQSFDQTRTHPQPQRGFLVHRAFSDPGTDHVLATLASPEGDRTMSRKNRPEKKSDSKPFFARYLEGQPTEGSAEVAGGAGLGFKKAIRPPIQTLKFPSDGDELHYCPYYASTVDVPDKYKGSGLVTLKYPSDRDEDIYLAEYLTKAAAPKGAVKAKGGAVKLKKRPAKKR